MLEVGPRVQRRDNLDKVGEAVHDALEPFPVSGEPRHVHDGFGFQRPVLDEIQRVEVTDFHDDLRLGNVVGRDLGARFPAQGTLEFTTRTMEEKKSWYVRKPSTVSPTHQNHEYGYS